MNEIHTEQNKVMTVREAVEKFVFDGATLGMGGQNVGRMAMAAIHEIVRQGKKNLTIYGCNLSINMDILVGAGLVKRCEAGTGNLEYFGTTFCFRRAIEQGIMEMEDYSHLGMISRLLAGEMGLPFMPTRSMLGSDMLTRQCKSTGKKYELLKDPWNPDEPVLLLPALRPDVALIHANARMPRAMWSSTGSSPWMWSWPGQPRIPSSSARRSSPRIVSVAKEKGRASPISTSAPSSSNPSDRTPPGFIVTTTTTPNM